jgi:TM2 domain-containing membrane protein YozV
VPSLVEPRKETTMTRQESMLAVGLEVGPGLLLQTFGIGHLYAGKVGTGLAIMFGYWFLQAVNVLLTSILIGFVTGPLTWLAFMVLSPTNVLSSTRDGDGRVG